MPEKVKLTALIRDLVKVYLLLARVDGFKREDKCACGEPTGDLLKCTQIHWTGPMYSEECQIARYNLDMAINGNPAQPHQYRAIELTSEGKVPELQEELAKKEKESNGNE